jgi:hypothetical protein
MITESQPLVEAIGKGLLRVAPESAWAFMELQLTAAGRMLESGLAVVAADGTLDQAAEIDDDTEDACVELRKAMYQPETGTWYNARFKVTPEGVIEAEFDYDTPPFPGEEVADLLRQDQERFPRDEAHLPDWHPSKAAG